MPRSMNFGPFPPMAGCQRYIGIFTDGIKVHSRNSSPMSSKEKKTSRIGFPPRLFRSSSSAGWKAKRQGSRPWTIPVGCDLPPTCCLVSFKQSFHLRFLYDLSSVENKAIFTLNYIISHFGRKQQERRLVVTLRTDELKVSSHRKP